LPFGESTLGALFGITDPLEGCDSLSRRITKQLALGKANQTFFLNTITATVPSGTQLKCNNQWSLITQTDHSELTVTNTGVLHITVQPQTSAKNFLHKAKLLQATSLIVKELKLEHPDIALPLLLDGETTLKTPVTITIKPKAIKVIVGKHRLV
jgi:diacylglycerol kinase family enzyme